MFTVKIIHRTRSKNRFIDRNILSKTYKNIHKIIRKNLNIINKFLIWFESKEKDRSYIKNKFILKILYIKPINNPTIIQDLFKNMKINKKLQKIFKTIFLFYLFIANFYKQITLKRAIEIGSIPPQHIFINKS